jgi:hypothetical protein
MASRKKIIVGGWSGIMSDYPLGGGYAWIPLQYCLGLRKLGHEAYLVDDLGLINGAGRRRRLELYSTHFPKLVDLFGIGDISTFIFNPGDTTGYVFSNNNLREVCQDADLLINISGNIGAREIVERSKRRVYVDLDPFFTQTWAAAYGCDFHFDEYDLFFTVGLAVGRPNCLAPTLGLQWHPLVQPVVLDLWRVSPGQTDGRFSTVADWNAHDAIWYEGEEYGPKSMELRKFIALPRLAREKIGLVLSIDPSATDDLKSLQDNDWIVFPPQLRDPLAYQAFIRDSKAECSVAKHGYVKSNCGWFSDRSACYLASGKPVLMQETGFSQVLPTGEGLLSFRTLEEAMAGIEEINRDYGRHSRAARGMAERYFDSTKVLADLLATALES